MDQLLRALLLVLLLPTLAWGVVAKTGAAGSSDGSPLSYTVAADADALAVGISLHNGGGGGVGTVSAVTYNGVAMTQVETAADNFAGGPYERVYLFQLTTSGGLTTGTHDVAVTTAGSVVDVVIGAQGFSGVDQATPVSNHTPNDSGAGTSTPTTVTVTSAVGEWTFAVAASTVALSGATQTELWNISTGASGEGAGADATGAASVTFEWTVAGGGDVWSTAALSFKAAAVAAGGYILTEAADCLNAENGDRLITEDVSAGVGPCGGGAVPQRTLTGVGT